MICLIEIGDFIILFFFCHFWWKVNYLALVQLRLRCLNNHYDLLDTTFIALFSQSRMQEGGLNIVHEPKRERNKYQMTISTF